MKRIFKVTFFILMLVMIFGINSYATTCKSVETDGMNFLEEGRREFEEEHDITPDTITNEIRPIIQMLIAGGVLIVGIAFVILGIQWVMSEPSPNAQAKIKQKLVALVITSGIIFGSYTIFRIIVTILVGIEDELRQP